MSNRHYDRVGACLCPIELGRATATPPVVVSMTSGVNMSDDTKREWDELKPDDMTHGEFAQELLDAYRRDNGEIVDVDALVQEITERTVTNVELAAYRGTKAAHKDHG